MNPTESTASSRGIAMIGMACRVPGANSPTAFWHNLCAGVDSVEYPDEAELRAAGISEAHRRDSRYVRACYPLADVEGFDAGFFHYSPREAAVIDPQQRHFLECSWEALEDAGYDPFRGGNAIGLFAGAGGSVSSYLFAYADYFRDAVGTSGSMIHLGNDKDYLTTRVSHKLDLRGPSVSVQTACSTSLAAVHLACQSLWAGECDMALAGGVTIRVPHRVGYLYDEGSIASPDGRCRAFDARAQGTVFGSGVGIVVLKPLARALEDRDHIYAVIKGSALNNDGGAKISYTAPSVEGQARAVVEALAVADVSPDTIVYVEAHGTATYLGDPLEIDALRRAFRAGTARKQFCAIGSVKTNIGHLEAAAGVAGLIKTALALHHRRLPPTLHFEQPNPRIDFAESPFFVNTKLNDWPATSGPLRAGVHSLGMGGTNVHVVLEEAPPLPRRCGPSNGFPALLCLSAPGETPLRDLVATYARFLEKTPAERLADVCFTSRVGRAQFPQRLAVLAESPGQASAKLRQFLARGEATGLWTGRIANAGDAPAGIAGAAAKYVQGQAIDEAAVDPDSSNRSRVPLPTYPFQHERCWIDPRRADTPPSPEPRRVSERHDDSCLAPSLTRRASSPVLLGPPRESPLTGEICYEAGADPVSLPFLPDHRIYGKVVVPGATYLSFALGALTREGTPCCLENVEFPRALVAAEQGPPVQLVLSGRKSRSRTFQAFSRAGDAWTCHAVGAIGGASMLDDSLAEPMPATPWSAIEEVAAQDLRRSYRHHGLDLGAAFGGIRRLWRGTDVVHAELVTPPALEGQGEDLPIHPAMLDACIQLGIALTPAATHADGELFIPWCIERLSLSNRPGSRFFCVARRRAGEATNAETVTTDLQVFDAEGRPCGRLDGLTLKRAPRAQFEEHVGTRLDSAQSPCQLVVRKRGTLDSLTLDPCERSRPGPGEVQIEVRASGLNFRDVLNALDMYPGDSGALGMECAGTIGVVGPGVTGFAVGDEVVALAFASLSSSVRTAAALVVPKPANLSFAEAATLPVAFATAHLGLVRLAKLRRNERVLIHSAAGGVGLAAVQVAQRAGAEIFATAGKSKWDHLRSLGITHIMDSHARDFADQIAQATQGQGVDVVLNSLSGDFIPLNIKALAPGGRFLEIGKRGIWTAAQVAESRADIGYHVIALDQVMKDDPGTAGGLLREIVQAVAGGELQPLVNTVFPIGEAVAAFRRMQQARHIGKIVLSIGAAAPSPAIAPAPVADAAPAPVAQGGWSDRLCQAVRDRRPELVREYLQAKVIHVLGLENSLPDHDMKFPDMGLDSLMTVELRNLVKEDLGKRFALSPTLIFDYPTITALARHLVEQLQQATDSRAA